MGWARLYCESMGDLRLLIGEREHLHRLVLTHLAGVISGAAERGYACAYDGWLIGWPSCGLVLGRGRMAIRWCGKLLEIVAREGME